MLHKSVQFKLDDVEGREISGYASTYEEDLGGDIIMPGAFTKTLAENGNRVKTMWQHMKSIGKLVHHEERSNGIFVVNKLSKTRLADEAIELVKDEVIDRMSIGYSVPRGKSDYSESYNTRKIRELKLYEVSLVDFPMNEGAVITGIKSVRDAIQCGNLDRVSMAELKEMLSDLTALLASEPGKPTHNATQPPEMDELKKLIENFGR